MATRRRYTDEERANAIVALAANGGNVGRTARQLDVPEKTLANWASGKAHPEAANDGGLKRGAMADAFEAIAWKILDSLPDKLPDATFSQACVGVGIAVDKMRLLREEATSIASARPAAVRIIRATNKAEGSPPVLETHG